MFDTKVDERTNKIIARAPAGHYPDGIADVASRCRVSSKTTGFSSMRRDARRSWPVQGNATLLTLDLGRMKITGTAKIRQSRTSRLPGREAGLRSRNAQLTGMRR